MTMIATYTDTALVYRPDTLATCRECACRGIGTPAPGEHFGAAWVCWAIGLITCDEAPACTEYTTLGREQ